MPSLKGTVGSPGLTDLLLSFHNAAITGRLRVERDGVRRELWIREGVLVAAESTAECDAIESLLLTADVLTRERHDAVLSRLASGGRRGPALVESARITPGQLVEWTGRRVRFLACDILCWREGEFAFEEGEAPPEGRIDVTLSLQEIVLEALRGRGAARSRHAVEESWVPVPVRPVHRGAGPVGLLPEEAYVLSLVDGRRTAGAIAAVAEFGPDATRAILHRLLGAGVLAGGDGARTEAGAATEPETREEAPDGQDGEARCGLVDWLDLPDGDSQNTLRAIIRAANDLFVATGAYMGREIGPISEQLLDKALRDARAQHPALLHRVGGTRDGALPEETLIRNIGLVKEHDPRAILLSGLESYLGGILLAVRRYLGPEHERCLRHRARETGCHGV